MEPSPTPSSSLSISVSRLSRLRHSLGEANEVVDDGADVFAAAVAICGGVLLPVGGGGEDFAGGEDAESVGEGGGGFEVAGHLQQEVFDFEAVAVFSFLRVG